MKLNTLHHNNAITKLGGILSVYFVGAENEYTLSSLAKAAEACSYRGCSPSKVGA